MATTRSKTLALCEETWSEGMPLKVTSEGFPIVMKPSMNCEYTVEKTNDIAFVGFPEDPKDKLVEMIRRFLVSIPRLTAEDLEEAEEGVYTWIYASKDGGQPMFYASRTTVMLELGTVHYSIATAVGATAVHGAGELWKHGGEYTFNFLSGTFMEKWQLPRGCTLKSMQELLKTKLRETFAYLYRAKVLKFTEIPQTFINTRFLVLTTAELEGYVAAGFKVCIHGSDGTKEDRARAHTQCKTTKTACKKPMALQEQMKGGVPPTPRKPTQRISQFEEARRLLTLGQLARPESTALAPVPVSRVEGMGGRKTKKRRKVRRITKRTL